ncbi:MAG: MerR family transcriptional regulator [Verrucomicrobiales bacterium]|nr:MerR family transcriptional regulator [Verrucomicrobiales bacterium]
MKENRHPRKRAAKKAARKQALKERLETMEQNDPQMRLPEFVERVNKIAARFGPRQKDGDGRVTSEFTERTVRHYQSKGIIDPPVKEGKEAIYGYRQVLQALLVRKMLVRKISAERISDMLDGKENEVYLELLTKGIEMSVGPGTGEMIDSDTDPALVRGPWIRIPVVPGLEVHIARGFEPPEGPEAFREMMQKIGQSIRQVIKRRRERRLHRG